MTTSVGAGQLELMNACQRELVTINYPKNSPGKHYIRIENKGGAIANPLHDSSKKNSHKASLTEIANLIAERIIKNNTALTEEMIQPVSDFLEALIKRIDTKKRESKLSCIRDLFYAIFGCIKKSPEQRLREVQENLKRLKNQKKVASSENSPFI